MMCNAPCLPLAQRTYAKQAGFVRCVCSQARVCAAGGNARLIKALADHVPILYHTPASRVAYGKSGATVETEAGTAISADACVVTVPLGVLKRGHIEFAPPLPEAKLAAIHRLGCVYDSVCLVHTVSSQPWLHPRCELCSGAIFTGV